MQTYAPGERGALLAAVVPRCAKRRQVRLWRPAAMVLARLWRLRRVRLAHVPGRPSCLRRTTRKCLSGDFFSHLLPHDVEGELPRELLAVFRVERQRLGDGLHKALGIT